MPPPSRSARLSTYLLALAVVGVVSGVLLLLLPLAAVLISLALLLLGLGGMVLFHYAMWAYIGEGPDEPYIPPDPQGRRGPPHRNGSPRPGDPFYTRHPH